MYFVFNEQYGHCIGIVPTRLVYPDVPSFICESELIPVLLSDPTFGSLLTEVELVGNTSRLNVL